MDLRKQAMIEDYREVLSTEAGRRVFGGIFHRLGLNAPVYDLNPQNMAYKAGIHDAVLRIAEAVAEAGPELIGLCEAEWVRFGKQYIEHEEDES